MVCGSSPPFSWFDGLGFMVFGGVCGSSFGGVVPPSYLHVLCQHQTPTDFNLCVASDFGLCGWFPIWGCGWIFPPPHLGVWLDFSPPSFWGCGWFPLLGCGRIFFFATIYSAHSLWPNALCRNLVPFAGIEYRLRELFMIMIMI